MKRVMDDVTAFHTVADQSAGVRIELDSHTPAGSHAYALMTTLQAYSRIFKDLDGDAALRIRLMAEELGEVIEGMLANDPVMVADGLVDLTYVVAGTGVTYGLPLDAVWEEVQRANMDKFPGGVATKDANGKVIKPDGWRPPNVGLAMRRAGYVQPDGWYMAHDDFKDGEGVLYEAQLACVYIKSGDVIAHIACGSGPYNRVHIFDPNANILYERPVISAKLHAVEDPDLYDEPVPSATTSTVDWYPKAIAWAEEQMREMGFIE